MFSLFRGFGFVFHFWNICYLQMLVSIHVIEIIGLNEKFDRQKNALTLIETERQNAKQSNKNSNEGTKRIVKTDFNRMNPSKYKLIFSIKMHGSFWCMSYSLFICGDPKGEWMDIRPKCTIYMPSDFGTIRSYNSLLFLFFFLYFHFFVVSSISTVHTIH